MNQVQIFILADYYINWYDLSDAWPDIVGVLTSKGDKNIICTKLYVDMLALLIRLMKMCFIVT